MPPIVLVTGFAPFGGERVNPSWEAARLLEGWTPRGRLVAAREIPCAFDTAIPALEAQIAQLQPEMAILVGQAGGRSDLSIERVAVNLDEAEQSDNRGAQPAERPVVVGGPAAYFASLPVRQIVAALRAAGLPASVSRSAGGFVCNHLFYGARHLAETRFSAMRVGFIHVPYSPAQGAGHPGAPTMAVETVAAGLRIVVETALAAADGAP